MQRRQLLMLALASLGVSACKTQSGYSAVFDEPPRPATATASPVVAATPVGTPSSWQSPRIAATTLERAAASPTPVSRPAAVPTSGPLAGARERLLVRQAGASAPLVGVDVATGATAFTVPADLATPDGQHWIGLRPAGGATAVTLYAARDGSPLRTFSAPGRYSQGAVAHDSQRLLLAAPPAAGAVHPVSEVALIDLTTGAVVLHTSLPGRYHADTIDGAGKALYLIADHPERLHNAYEVTRYDLVTKQVISVADKRSSQSIMSGYKVSQVWSKTGEWLYSLYLSPGADGAFIHALNLPNRFAACIDLPSGNASEAQLQQYALAIAPAGDRVFAVNPAISVINSFSVGDFSATTVWLLLPNGSKVSGATVSRPVNNCLVTPDGATLYAGTAQGILVLPATKADLRPTSVLLAGQSVSSLGMNAGGTLLFALVDGVQRRLLALDPTSGAVRGDLSGSVAQPAGIEQVVPA